MFYIFSFPWNLLKYWRHTFRHVECSLSVSFWRNNEICNPVIFTVICNGFCTELCKSASHANAPELKHQSCSERCSLHLYTVNGTFSANCPVLRGQKNVSFRKPDSLLFSSWLVGQAPTVLELEQKGHSCRAAKDCVLVRLLHLLWVKKLWTGTPKVFLFVNVLCCSSIYLPCLTTNT